MVVDSTGQIDPGSGDNASCQPRFALVQRHMDGGFQPTPMLIQLQLRGRDDPVSGAAGAVVVMARETSPLLVVLTRPAVERQ